MQVVGPELAFFLRGILYLGDKIKGYFKALTWTPHNRKVIIGAGAECNVNVPVIRTVDRSFVYSIFAIGTRCFTNKDI